MSYSLRILAATVAAVIALCSGTTAQQTKAPVQIAADMPLTGSGAFIGQSMVKVLDVIEKEVNAQGGIQGRPVHFEVTDNETNPQLAVQLANRAIAGGAQVVIDGGPAVICHAIAPLYNNGPVLYCLSPAFYPPKGGYQFAANVMSKDGMATLLAYMRGVGWTRIAMLSATDTPGQEADEALKALLAEPENREMRVVAWEHFAPSDVSVAAQVARIKAANPQALFVWVTGTPNGTALRGLHDAGLDVPVFQSDANQLYAQMAQYGPIMPKQYYIFADMWSAYDDLRNGPLKRNIGTFYDSLKAAGLRPDLGAANLWDPVSIVISALRKLGPNATAQEIRDYILGLHDYVGVNGIYDFSQGNQRGITMRDMVVARWSPAAGTWLAVSGPGGVPKKR